MRTLTGLALAAMLVACGGGQKSKGGGAGPALIVTVDASIAPQRELPVPDGSPARPLAAAEDGSGHRVEFVENEVVILETTPGQAQDFAARNGGTVLESYPLDKSTVALVKVEAPAGDPARLPAVIKTVEPAAHGELRVSSAAAAKLLATIGAAGVDDGLTLMPNPVLAGTGVEERKVKEAPAGDSGWNPDITQLPGFRRGDAQDIGVAEAWRMLALSGRDANRVRVAVLDQGFHHDTDIDGATAIPGDAWNRAGSITCTAGAACPWHGTGVAQIIGGHIDNAYGAAGTGGQVADLILSERFGGDFFEIVRFLLDTLPRTISASPRIVNMSFGADIPAGWYALTFNTLDGIFAGIRLATGTLLLAAAGNDGNDVDSQDCVLGICWEGSVSVPCENAGVTCIGGMALDSTSRDHDSNYGTRKDVNSVELYAPFYNWVGPDPDHPESGNVARLIAGTSGATPFVAGVAAMIWAADPMLGVDQVEQILFETAHTDGSAAFRRIDAYAAVKRALGGNSPPYVTITSPTEGATFDRGSTSVNFSATVEDEEGGVSLQWASNLDGNLSTSSSFSTPHLSGGAQTITLTATDGPWTVSRSVHVTIHVPVPTVTITQPLVGNFYAGVPVSFGGMAYDPGEQADVPAASVSWHVGSATAAPFATGYEASYTFDTPGTFTIFLVAQGPGGKGMASLLLPVGPAPVNKPPVVNITNPAGATFDAGYPTTSDATGTYYAVTLQGTATDPESGALTGSWSRRRYKSGAAFEDLGAGNSKAVKLYVDTGQGATVWEVRFQASDGTNIVSDTVLITVHQLI